jgi:hypothetical protein
MLICSWLVLCLSAGLTFGQYDVHYSVGIRYQLASWDYKGIYTHDVNGDSSKLGSKTGNLFGPVLSISTQKISFSITYLLGSWKYDNIDTYIIFYDPYYGYFYDSDILGLTSKRTDLVITAAYQVIPRLSVFLGYKYLQLKHEFRYLNYPEVNEDVKGSGSGIGAGLSGSLQLAPKFHGYATLGYMHLGGDLDTENLIAEGGLRLYFGTTPIYGSFGYRYESFDSGDTILSGPVLTVAYYH